MCGKSYLPLIVSAPTARHPGVQHSKQGREQRERNDRHHTKDDMYVNFASYEAAESHEILCKINQEEKEYLSTTCVLLQTMRPDGPGNSPRTE